MSKFLEQIRNIRLTDKPYRIALPGSLTDISHEVEMVPPQAVRFIVSARIGSTLMVDERCTGAVQLRQQAINLQRSIAHEVYGDVRAAIMELWPDVYALRNDSRTWDTSKRIEAKLNEILAAIEP